MTAAWKPVLSWWFGDWSDHLPLTEDDPQIRRWWHGTPEVDAEVREHLEAPYQRARAGELESWLQTLEGTLCLVILFDQVPRNLFRDSGEAFATDEAAQQLVVDVLATGRQRELAPIEQSFLYMPLMHAEDLALQDEGVKRFEELAREVERTARADYYARQVDYAVKHRDIVARFGRFPHRNAVLGRQSTPDEAHFFATHGRGY